jgi:hypothetical protein
MALATRRRSTTAWLMTSAGLRAEELMTIYRALKRPRKRSAPKLTVPMACTSRTGLGIGVK